MRRIVSKSKSFLVIAGLVAAAVACDDEESDPVDQPMDGEDASVGQPDAAVGDEDATVGEPDAMVGEPDATVGEPDATVGEPDGGEEPDPAVARGKALTEANSCKTCHGTNYAGNGPWPNITPYALSSWTDAEIASAITDGVGKGGETLCAMMERYDFTEAEVADVVAFLRSLAPVTKANQLECM